MNDRSQSGAPRSILRRRGRPQTRQTGFTLLEMIIAIAVFVLISTAAYAAMGKFLDDQQVLEERNQFTQRLQALFTLLERDIRFAVHRPVRSDYDHERFDDQIAMCFLDDDACSEGDRLRLTSHQLEPTSINPVGGRLKRIAWRLEGGRIIRVSWESLDRVQDTIPRERVIVKGVDELTIKPYFPREEAGDSAAPASASASIADPRNYQFKSGVIEVLVSIDSRQYRRLLELPDGA